ncbi:hypothetical protein NIB75_01485 [Bacteroides uniformis]|nr:hypothetical protein [Bacteroides uniformis]
MARLARHLEKKVDKRCENYEIERKGIIGEVERAGYGKMIFHLTDFLSQIIIGFCLECVFSVIQATVADFGLFQSDVSAMPCPPCRT